MALLAGCAAPGQYGGPIPVDHAGTTVRLETLCAVASQSVCGVLAVEGDGGLADEAREAEGPADAAAVEATAR